MPSNRGICAERQIKVRKFTSLQESERLLVATLWEFSKIDVSKTQGKEDRIT